MKKLKKGLYVLIPALLIVCMYGIQGNVITSLAKVITTRVTVLTEIVTNINEDHTSPSHYPTPTPIIIATQTYTIIETEIEVSDEVTPQVVPTKIPTPQNDYATFMNVVSESITKMMDNLAKGITDTVSKEDSLITVQEESIVIDAKEWISFNRKVYQSIADAGKDVTILYTYEGEKYSVTIPAGYDIMSLVNEEGYCGFLNLAAHLGATVVEE